MAWATFTVFNATVRLAAYAARAARLGTKSSTIELHPHDEPHRSCTHAKGGMVHPLAGVGQSSGGAHAPSAVSIYEKIPSPHLHESTSNEVHVSNTHPASSLKT